LQIIFLYGLGDVDGIVLVSNSAKNRFMEPFYNFAAINGNASYGYDMCLALKLLTNKCINLILGQY
jgi:hypothetical protein